jgi:hypothetical protein
MVCVDDSVKILVEVIDTRFFSINFNMQLRVPCDFANDATKKVLIEPLSTKRFRAHRAIRDWSFGTRLAGVSHWPPTTQTWIWNQHSGTMHQHEVS